MQSSVLTKPDVAETEATERRRPGRFDDVNLELVPLLRGEAPAETQAMVPEYDFLSDTASLSARDPVAERETAFKIVLIIVALVGLVMLFGK